jgi:nuclear RNA export factor
VLDWDNVKFAGVNLTITADVITELFNEAMESATPQNSSTTETIKVLEEVLRTRYNPENKMLDLSKLGEDPLLRQNGFFELNSTTSKMFPALMSVADKKFDTAQQKRDAIHSVSLAFNNLKTITQVTTLSVTFPDLKNLSLEGNIIDLKGLEGWKNRFKGLEQLVLVGNPVTDTPGYREEIIRRYQKLVMLDNESVNRPQIQIGDQGGGGGGTVQKPNTVLDANGLPLLPLPIKGNLLVDTNGIAMQFLSTYASPHTMLFLLVSYSIAAFSVRSTTTNMQLSTSSTPTNPNSPSLLTHPHLGWSQ